MAGVVRTLTDSEKDQIRELRLAQERRNNPGVEFFVFVADETDSYGEPIVSVIREETVVEKHSALLASPPADEAQKASEKNPPPPMPRRVHDYDPDAKEEPGHGPDDIAVSREDRELVSLQHFG